MRRRTSSGCPLATLTHLDTATKRSVRADAVPACRETKQNAPIAKANEDVITSQHIMWEAEVVGLLFEHSNSTPS